MRRSWLSLVLIVMLLLTSCGPKPTPEPAATATPTAAPTQEPAAEDVIYLAIIWHQHQPVYFKDPQTGIYAKPWVRLHAAKDYVDMAAMLKAYPKVHVTFNLTPSLIRQLDDLQAGTKDTYWVHTEIPADQLTDEQKSFILRYFFDINPKIIQRFPRYVELRDKRPADVKDVNAYTTQDYLDLQVLFNLGWTDPDFLAQPPLAELVAKERNFTEADKAVVLEEHKRLIAQVIPIHKELQDAGQIEVTMTPFAHPILPLLIDTGLAKIAMPSAELPAPAFRYGQDAVEQLERGVQLYQEHFGVAPRGMWPAEGSVDQLIVNMVGLAGLRWMASDEGVLAKSIGLDGFTRNPKDVVQQADKLYRPYTVVGSRNIPVAMVFRDVVISDKVGFTYSGLPGKAAAKDFINRIHAIREQLKAENATGPHLVTVILDGENAWEYYDNDGKEFLNTLYQLLSEDKTIVTVTPSEYLDKFPSEPSAKIDNLWAGSWINHDFSTWIGEDEENRAWTYLAQVREFLSKYERGQRQAPSAEALEKARTYMLIAEGSDWFWWYGTDQNSGADEDFDKQYRDTLKQVYLALGETPPDWLDVPIIAQAPASAQQAAKALITPQLDGVAGEGEWDAAGYYEAAGGAMASGSLPLTRLYYGFDAQHLYLRVDAAYAWGALAAGQSAEARTVLGFYLLPPGPAKAQTVFSRYGRPTTILGFGATRLAVVTLDAQAKLVEAQFYAFDGETWSPTGDTFAVAFDPNGQVLEAALPLAVLAPQADSGDRIQLRAVLSQGVGETLQDVQILPTSGPSLVVVPDLGLTTPVLEVTDPSNDDHGPGSYTYATDAVFQPGVFDATAFNVSYDDENIVFRFSLRGPLQNPWGSPNGVSVQTFDVYIDKDGPASGERLLLPGRNAALSKDYAWDYVIWVEGWTPAVYVPSAEGPKKIDAPLTIIADPGQSKVTIKVPKAILGDNPQDWAYAAMVLGQEGFPASGVWRVRDVEASAQQWRFGGAPADANHTRIIDLIWPANLTPTQEEMLSTYKPAASVDGLGPDDFAQIGMLKAK